MDSPLKIPGGAHIVMLLDAGGHEGKIFSKMILVRVGEMGCIRPISPYPVLQEQFPLVQLHQ